jgi:hypothetical protein
VALCWLLFMTLWLPLLDQAKSYRLVMARMAPHISRGDLVCAPDAPVGLLTAMEYFDGYRVNGLSLTNKAHAGQCTRLVLRIQAHERAPAVPGWTKIAQYNQRTHNSEQIVIYRRRPNG